VVAKLKIKWVRSAIGYRRDQLATIRALGLRRLNDTVEHEDSPSIRGMVSKVKHLLVVQEAGD